jgi:hypothetical protein
MQRFAPHHHLVGGRARKTLALEAADLDLSPVQRAGVPRGEVTGDAAREARGGGLAEDLCEAAAQRGIEGVSARCAVSPSESPRRSIRRPKLPPSAVVRRSVTGTWHVRRGLDGDEAGADAGALGLVARAQQHPRGGRQGARLSRRHGLRVSALQITGSVGSSGRPLRARRSCLRRRYSAVGSPMHPITLRQGLRRLAVRPAGSSRG